MKTAARRRIDLYQYPEEPNPPKSRFLGFWETEDNACANGAGHTQMDPEAQEHARLQAARRQGFEEGRQAERKATLAARAHEDKARVEHAASLIAAFAEARDKYLQAVEREVVELSLAIAARILRREAQMDPLLLTGAVRVALGQLGGNTEVRLRVPQADLPLWNEAIAHLPSLAVKPTLIAAPGLAPGDCVIETNLGSVDLGVRAQLVEIERGFFDRSASHPAQKESGPSCPAAERKP